LVAATVLAPRLTWATTKASPQGSDWAAQARSGASDTRFVAAAWTNDGGLPLPEPTRLAHAPGGFLWVGTKSGYARFDGKSFRSIGAPGLSSMRHGWVYGLTHDTQGKLWGSTKGQPGLVTVGPDGHSEPQFAQATGLVRALAADDQGRLFTGGPQGFAVVHSKPGAYGSRQAQRLLPAAFFGGLIEAVRAARGGGVFIGALDGLYLWDDTAPLPAGSDGEAAQAQRTTKIEVVGLSLSAVQDVAQMPDGSLWVASATGVHQLEPRAATSEESPAGATRSAETAGDGVPEIGADTKWRLIPPGPGAPTSKAYRVIRDADGRIWAGTRSGLFFRSANGRWQRITPPEASMQIVWDLLPTGEGTLWAATNGGLLRLRKPLFANEPLPQASALAGDTPTAFVLDESNRPIVGTAKGTVATPGRLYPGPVSTPTGTCTPFIRTLAKTQSQDIWFGGDPGAHHTLCRIDSNGEAMGIGAAKGLKAGEPVRLIHEDKKGQLWVGTWRLLRWDRTRERFERQELPGAPNNASNEVLRLYEDSDNTLWVAGRHGIWRHDGSGFVAYRPAGTERYRWIFDIQQSLDESTEHISFWLGGDRGFARLQQQELIPFTAGNGFVDAAVFQILQHTHTSAPGEVARLDLWLATSSGVLRVRRKDVSEFVAGALPTLPYTHFGTSVGVPANAISPVQYPVAQKDSRGHLWFLTPAGLARVDPEAVDRPQPSRRTAIEGVWIAGEQQRLRGTMAVRRASHTGGKNLHELVVGYTAPALDNAEGLRFRHRLRPLEAGWVQAGAQRQARYTNLPPGEYTFEVAAHHITEGWEAEPVALPVHIHAAWSRSPLLQGALAIACAALLYALHRWRLARALARS